MTAILGVSALYHDSAAALVVDGRIVAAAQEERFTRRKHDAGFPHRAIAYCLREANLEPDGLDYVAFYDKPLRKFDRYLETALAFAPRGLRSFVAGVPGWLREKLHVRKEFREAVGKRAARRIVFAEHHESHAASAFFPSPFEEAAVLTLDGVGEWATASFGTGRGKRLELTHELRFPHSLGLLYSAFTSFCGFRVNSGEYKLMGLAPFGEPAYADVIRERLLRLSADGSFRIDQRYFDYCHGLRMTNRRFADLFGGPARKPEAELTEREKDLAASIQLVTEEIVLAMARHVHERTGQTKLCLAGGVALNCVANGRLLRESPFERLWIQPAAGDAGGALGVALFVWHQLLEKPRASQPEDSQQGSLLGPQFSDDEISTVLDRAGAAFTFVENDAELCRRTAGLVAEGGIVGWFQGRMEFGPRALGARSILADPRKPEMPATINARVKFREAFRPFAPAVLKERADAYFDLAPAADGPYMTLVADVRPEVRAAIPAVTHVDGTARFQTVDERHGRFRSLLQAFEERTGCPVLLNTSFNVRGEPIVCTPQDAWRCFLAADLDALVVGRFLLLKDDQPESVRRGAEQHLARFAPD